MATKLVIALITGPPVLLTSAYVWNRCMNKDEFQILDDAEFNGFKCVLVPPPSNEQSSAKTYCALPVDFMKQAIASRNVLRDHLHPLDVFVASYPKSGTSWLSEVVYLLVNHLNWEAANGSNLEERVPYFEYIYPGPNRVKSMPIPRVIKTHLPYTHLPKQVQNGRTARVIYIVRDPRDVVVSYYHFARCFVPAGYKNLEGIRGFSRRFVEGTLPYSPWADHVKSYTQAENEQKLDSELLPKILIIQYEQMKANPYQVIRHIESFLHRTWSSGDVPMPPKLSEVELEQVVEHCSFKSMKANPQTNYSWYKEAGLWKSYTSFMRRGVVGDHQSSLPQDQSDAIVKMAEESGLSWTLAND